MMMQAARARQKEPATLRVVTKGQDVWRSFDWP